MVDRAKDRLSSKISENNLIRLFFFALVTLSIVGLSATLISISVNKPIGDDFGAIDSFEPVKWLNHTTETLKTTGRYGQGLVGSIAYGVFGRHIVTLLPLIVTTWFLILAHGYIRHFLLKTGAIESYIITGLTLFVTFSVLFMNNNVDYGTPPAWISYQLFFWPSGIITYTIPLLILLSGIYVLFIKRENVILLSRKKIALLAVLVYISGLFNETQPMTIFFIAIGSLIFSYLAVLKILRPWRSAFIVSAVASILSLLTLLFSPGSQQRQAATSTARSSINEIAGAVIHNLQMILTHLYFRPRELLLIVGMGVAIAYFASRSKSVQQRSSYDKPVMILSIGLLLLLLCIGALVCSTALSAYGYGAHSGILTRTFFIPQLLSIISILFISLGASLVLQRKRNLEVVRWGILSIAIAVTLISLPRYLAKITTQVNSSLAYSNIWTDEDRLLRQRASEHSTQPVYLPPSAAGIGDGFSLRCKGPHSDSTIWLNNQIEEYYGVKEVCSSEDLTSNQR